MGGIASSFGPDCIDFCPGNKKFRALCMKWVNFEHSRVF